MNTSSLLAVALAVPAVVAPVAAQADWRSDRMADLRADYRVRESRLQRAFQADVDHLNHDLRHALQDHDHVCARRLRGEISDRHQLYHQQRRDLLQWFNDQVRAIEHARHDHHHHHHHQHSAARPGFQLQLGGVTIGTTPVRPMPGYVAPAPAYQAPAYQVPAYQAPYAAPAPAGQVPGGPGFFRPDYSQRTR